MTELQHIECMGGVVNSLVNQRDMFLTLDVLCLDNTLVVMDSSCAVKHKNFVCFTRYNKIQDPLLATQPRLLDVCPAWWTGHIEQ